MSKLILSLAAGAVLAPVSAVNATTAPDPREQQIEQIFTTIDTDRDGYIDADEARAIESLRIAFPRLAKSGRLEKQRFVSWYKDYDRAPADE